MESTRLQGFTSKIRHYRSYGNRRSAASKGNVLRKSGCTALCHFQLINIFLLVWVPDAGTVFKFGTDDSLAFLQVLRTSIQSTGKSTEVAHPNFAIKLVEMIQYDKQNDYFIRLCPGFSYN